MERIVITGGTGFIGLSLAKFLKAKGYTPVLIARHLPKKAIDYKFVQWDGFSVGDWAKELDGAKAIVNLAGRSVDCVKTPEHCDEILRSRVESTRVIGKALAVIGNPPKVWVQMSTAHIYGDSETRRCAEDAASGYGLAPEVGKAWEQAFHEGLPKSVRGVVLRTSFVLGKHGGALQQLKLLARLGLGGKVGSGLQGMSWIHEADLNQLIYDAIEKKKYNGMYIASAPNPVSNKDFMQTLRRVLHMPIGLPSPKWLASIGAYLLFNTDPELALYGRYVVPERLMRQGHAFKFPELSHALSDLV